MKNANKKTNEIIEKIEAEKEILKTMPKNNKKNIKKYSEKIEELKNEYSNLNNKITKEMNKRYQIAISIENNPEINKINAELNKIEKILLILNEQQTSYEKMGLDKIIYKIDKYYKGNLEDINEQIYLAIQKFEEVGIKLKLSDFNYSIFVSQYMETFFDDKTKGDKKAKKLQQKFEEVYWKCSDIIIHIELNLRKIYMKNENDIDKYFEKEKNNIIRQYEKKREDIKKMYEQKVIKRDKEIERDKKQILDDFLNQKLNVADFEEEKIKSNYSKLLPELSDEEFMNEDVQKGIKEFLRSLYEYRNYLKFEFIIKDIQKYYKEKEKYKNSYKEAKKKVEDIEKKIKKINKKATRKGIFKKTTKKLKQTPEQKQITAEAINAYKEMELNKFYNKIYSILRDDSTIYETLELASSYYNYLTKCIIENNSTITQDKIDRLIDELKLFLKNPYINIINNLTILEENDIAMIIKDRYKLLNFNIDKDDLDEKKLNGLIKILENIEVNYNLKILGLDIKKIGELIEIKQVLNVQ